MRAFVPDTIPQDAGAMQPALSCRVPYSRRQKYSATRAYYLILLFLAVLLCFRYVKPSNLEVLHTSSAGLWSRSETFIDGQSQVGAGHDCRLVHAAENQCEYVKRHCPDEEAGLFSYLQLYYCSLPRARALAFLLLSLWLGMLFSTIGIAASDFFCINLSTIASILGMSESLTGVTFLAFGNGSPDVFSTFAAMKSHSGSLAIGELIGAAGFITAVVAGSMALVRPFKVARRSFVRDVSFFIVAASFSMIFLSDGHLALWECIAMVGFYIFYVIFVVVWHWYLRKQGRRRHLEEAARSHFHLPGIDQGNLVDYVDNEEDGVASRKRSRATTRTISADDFGALERANGPNVQAVNDDMNGDDETRDRYLAEISSNMRLNRPRFGERRNTTNPIRPSLVGALEFRAVLTSLQKSRNIQTIPINMRRYSDDPNFTTSQQQESQSMFSNPVPDVQNGTYQYRASGLTPPGMEESRNAVTRTRAVSANDASHFRLDPATFRNTTLPIPEIALPSPSSEGSVHTTTTKMLDSNPPLSLEIPRDENTLNIVASPLAMSPVVSPSGIEPAEDYLNTPDGEHGSMTKDQLIRTTPTVTRTSSTRPSTLHPERSMSGSPGLRPNSPFPQYFDDPTFVPSISPSSSFKLPPSSLDPESTYDNGPYPDNALIRIKWWPYKLIPAPDEIFETLFPTLYCWRDKTVWDKLLGLAAAPSIFFLAITLPVVEANDDGEGILHGNIPAAADAISFQGPREQSTPIVLLPKDSPNFQPTSHEELTPVPKQNRIELTSPSIQVTSAESTDTTDATACDDEIPQIFTPQDPVTKTHEVKGWNRWLFAIQLFTAPWFIIVLFWANTQPDKPRALLLLSLYSILGSLIALALLLIVTKPDCPPKNRHLICFLGFIVAIAWISTIANEVVGVLKAIGIILNISDAILGLTIFAVGNSLGDLVADITVARLGYPVMALSACLGGPMLNILLGIGLGGSYMSIHGADRRRDKHPDRLITYKPYEIEIGTTLLISGVTLLVTLVGLLVVVPMRGWWMDRHIGWGLIALWTASTIGNVIVEVMGIGADSL